MLKGINKLKLLYETAKNSFHEKGYKERDYR
jgi:hypothetical protein